MPENATVNDKNLIWIDLEMTGLDTQNDVIIEIATIVTDSELNILAEGPMLAIHQSDEIMAGMDEWNTKQHGGSGLTERVKNSSITEAEAERQTIAGREAASIQFTTARPEDEPDSLALSAMFMQGG